MSESLRDLSRALGVNLVDSTLPEGSHATFGIRLNDLPKPHGFEIRIQQSLMSTRATLVLDNFSADFLRMCKSGFAERGDEVLSVLESAKTSGFEYDFKINGSADSNKFNQLEWETFDLSLFKRVANYDEALNCLKLTVLLIVSSILPMITEQVGELEEETAPNYQIEGNLQRIYVNKYERSRLNRAICLELYGFVCSACNLRMADVYGPIGEGVIHVHHIEPVSMMDAPRVLNPATDLVPLCPNCHVIVHRTNPPLSIAELRDSIGK